MLFTPECSSSPHGSGSHAVCSICRSSAFTSPVNVSTLTWWCTSNDGRQKQAGSGPAVNIMASQEDNKTPMLPHHKPVSDCSCYSGNKALKMLLRVDVTEAPRMKGSWILRQRREYSWGQKGKGDLYFSSQRHDCPLVKASAQMRWRLLFWIIIRTLKEFIPSDRAAVLLTL